jgi:hypothetical protein
MTPSGVKRWWKCETGETEEKYESTYFRMLGVVAAIRTRDIPIRRNSGNYRTAI